MRKKRMQIRKFKAETNRWFIFCCKCHENCIYLIIIPFDSLCLLANKKNKAPNNKIEACNIILQFVY